MAPRLADVLAGAVAAAFVASPAIAGDPLTARTLTEVCFPELMDQFDRDPDLTLLSSIAYGLDYNQNIEADLSRRDVLYKRAENGVYHLDIGGTRDEGFDCTMTLPESVSLADADATVAELVGGRDLHRFPRLGAGSRPLRWSRTDPVPGGEVQRSVGVWALEGDGRVRISVRLTPFRAP